MEKEFYLPKKCCKISYTSVYTGVLISPQLDQEGKKLMFLSEWREFPSAPCLAGKKKLMTSRVSMLLKSRASLTCFRACFLFLFWLRTYQHPCNLYFWSEATKGRCQFLDIRVDVRMIYILGFEKKKFSLGFVQ